MHIFIVAVCCLVGGLAVGVAGHAFFAAKALASKEELQAFSARLRTAFDSDVQTAKNKVATVIADIEKKL
jgi:hypothetical protein